MTLFHGEPVTRAGDLGFPRDSKPVPGCDTAARAVKRPIRPYGQVLKAIRENEPRAVSLGYDVDKYKLLAYVLSTALAGLAGSMKTLVLGFATLSDAHWSLSGEVVLMTLLGGMGTFAGPVLGAFTIIALQDYLADRVGSWVTVIIGVIFVLCVVAFRRGFVGELLEYQKRFRAR